MADEAEVQIGIRAVTVPEIEIIRAQPQVAKKEISLALQKVEVPMTIPPSDTPLPAPTIPPSPLPPAPIIPLVPGGRSLILNIETTGYEPWKHRIIAIGLQDPMMPDAEPLVLMEEDEIAMLNQLFTIIANNKYSELIGYGLSFDFRFIVLRAMKYNINCKEFTDIELYDLGQAMAQVKFKFVYFAQKQPVLSDLADFFWGYPKPFTDLEMMKYYELGQFDKVREFTSSQITRILLLYYLFRSITETNFTPTASGIVSETAFSRIPPTNESVSMLTIPEAHAPETWLAKCPNDLSEWNVPVTQSEFTCPIDGTILKKA